MYGFTQWIFNAESQKGKSVELMKKDFFNHRDHRGHRERMNAIKFFLSLCSLCLLWCIYIM